MQTVGGEHLSRAYRAQIGCLQLHQMLATVQAGEDGVDCEIEGY